MERMEEVVDECDHQVLQQFISDAPWDARAVVDKVAIEADQLLGGTTTAALVIDETGFVKQGRKSVGTARQWLGRLGKQDNGQVAVFGALCAGDRVTAVDVQLYLPREWTDDPQRCYEAKVPEERLQHKTKLELALDIVNHQRELGVRFHWVCADSLYGQSSSFRRTLDDAGEQFLLDIHCDQLIYLEDPAPAVPERKSGRGRPPTKRKSTVAPTRIDQWAKSQPEDAWQKILLRDSTKGPIEVAVLHRRVWFWDGEEPEARCWHVVIRRQLETAATYKYSVSNAPEDAPTERLAYVQGQRYWIERTFEDGKSEVGMADYQTRGWRAWHHHMALVMIAMLFMVKHRMMYVDNCPLLSCHDIRVLLSYFLPQRRIDERELFRQLVRRHRKRASAILSANRKKHSRVIGLSRGS